MSDKLIPDRGLWTTWAPATLQAAFSMPTKVDPRLRGRVELVLGRLGAGKTTFASLRARQLAKASGRAVATTGQDWPSEWQPVSRWADLEQLRDVVLVLDEIHIVCPSMRGHQTKSNEVEMHHFLSMLRKRGVCVVATTQAWTKPATVVRQLVTTVWKCEAVHPRRLHRAIPHDPPDEGGRQCWAAAWYGPAAASIPTNAEVWRGQPDELVVPHLVVGEGESAERRAGLPAGAGERPPTIPHRDQQRLYRPS